MKESKDIINNCHHTVVNEAKKRRVEYLDIAKGLGIIFVVWYHLNGGPGRILNLFFMPLFFMISGMFLNLNVSTSVFFRKRVRQIIGPLLLGVLLGSVVEVVVNRFALFHETMESGYYNFGLVGNVPLWFLVALFWVMSMVYLTTLYVRPYWVRAAIFAALSIAGYLLSVFNVKNTLFLGQACLMLPFVLLGYYLKDFWLKGRWHRWYTPVVYLAGSILMYSLGASMNVHQMRIQTMYLPSMLCALFMVLTVFEVSRMLSGTRVGRLFSWIGEYTIFILILHYIFLHSLFPCIERITGSTPSWSFYTLVTLTLTMLLCLVCIFLGKCMKKVVPALLP